MLSIVPSLEASSRRVAGSIRVGLLARSMDQGLRRHGNERRYPAIHEPKRSLYSPTFCGLRFRVRSHNLVIRHLYGDKEFGTTQVRPLGFVTHGGIASDG